MMSVAPEELEKMTQVTSLEYISLGRFLKGNFTNFTHQSLFMYNCIKPFVAPEGAV